MHYRQFEKILIDVFSIDDSALGAFRARLRHLRTLGVPNTPKRGSGNPTSYRRVDLFMTSIALALETLGMTPTISALISKKAAEHVQSAEETELFLVVASLSHSDFDTPVPMPGMLRFGWLNTELGQTFSCVVEGAQKTKTIATSFKTAACVVMNLSEKLKALPGVP
jgi:hypothetical protein